MNIPRIKNIEDALRIFYTYSELGNKEILHLFGALSSATISRLKKMVKDEMSNRNIISYGMNKINTIIAFEVWGIDVEDLEKRLMKLKELKLIS
jgi:hypothetical protein